ncbi:Hypothetical protein I595_3140 [Croceitalea dokdonensis DOKDO 023]|uniref:Uncharacterized protein n=1 Tax=Croceitalea dokdonensis DOKDO 023 TaxID=1300341 RepID=A0A0N8H3I2_9FLAO|nr:Hypothetical protein I595_3140 [Croceitalea dokdonensis DOKDO 023]
MNYIDELRCNVVKDKVIVVKRKKRGKNFFFIYIRFEAVC